MRKICARHELKMLTLALSSLHGTEGGLHSEAHATVLTQIDHCTRCRRHGHRGPDAPTRVTVTFSLPEEIDPEEVTAAVEEVLPDYVDEVVIRVA
ncbi:hypothetical protein [Nocardioides sp.]|uniref:hypothetical protein n=1 Tax=Nocardioides sp. TaxID=35761 RepID=UPI0025DC7590|nr:hypothetical protein [Nocardioides sp.]